MPIITLTTDLGNQDYYVGSVKGAILSLYPEAKIVDITHEIPPFDLLKASFVIKNCFRDFPEGSIHIVGINPEANLETSHIVIKFQGHYFIGADNGIFSLITDQQPQKIIELDIPPETDMVTFPTKDIFVKAACHLAKGGTMEVIGREISDFTKRELIRAVTEGKEIRGVAMYIDRYGNILTNIKEDLFKKFGKGKPFTIYFRRAEYNITEISDAYISVDEGEKLALFSSSGYLEIAINRGNASKLFGIKQGDTIRIEFE